MLLRGSVAAVTLVIAAVSVPERPAPAQHGELLFADDFESGLDRWQVLGAGGVSLRRFGGFFTAQEAAWFDFYRNPDHAGRSIRVDLGAGPNDIVLRVIGGVYASGGFFARLARP